LEDRALARRQRVQSALELHALRSAGSQVSAAVERPLDTIQELLVVEGFLEEVDRPSLHGADGGWHASVAGEEDDGNIGSSLAQRRLEIQAARPGQPNIQHETCGP